YDSIAEVIEETKDTETIGVQEVIGSLKPHEQRLQRHTEKMPKKAFSSLSVSPREQSNSGQGGSSKSKKSSKPQKGKKWDTKPENNFRMENQNGGAKVPCKTCDKLHYGACWFKGKPKCYNCDKFGHLAKECIGKSAQTAHYATHKEEEGTMFYACHSTSIVTNNY
ncbi:PREDICTED: Retrovirus-related Pol poly from transposon, partial [Prunus dulcis]